jgi:superfamily I DNA and/or RNA helicase
LAYETKNHFFKKKKKEQSFFFSRGKEKKLFQQYFLKIWIGQNVKLPIKTQRIIVCAFSNAAIDENTARITSGLPMEKNRKIKNTFWILRLGPNYRYFLDHMTLDSLSLMWASENDDSLTVWNSQDILKKSKAFILNQAKIIYTTLSCASYPFLEKFKGKETLLIDEAAQAIEISTITAFRSTCEKIILIGDVQQLPATVFSQSSADLYFERSLFKRLQQQNFPIHFLEMQYRMHPQISSFISRKFYNNGLKDATNVTKIQSYHFLRCFGPMIFFDNFESFDRYHHNIKNTWCNLEEIRTISLILRSLICLFSSFNLRSLGIIASYRGQILEIREHGLIKKHHFKGQINTVDGFQGREKNVIFFSSVRVKYSGGIGFLSDCRRMNVAFTRAKFSFWGIGKASTLQRDYSWFEALVDFRRRGLFFSIKKPLERSNRRLIYWNEIDEKVFSEDGETFSLLDFFLIDYIKNIANWFG